VRKGLAAQLQLGYLILRAKQAQRQAAAKGFLVVLK